MQTAQTATIVMSGHAYKRLARRNLSPADVEFVLAHGTKTYRAGVVVYFLGRRHVLHTANAQLYDHLEGTSVVSCSHCRYIITAYRNRVRGSKDHDRKTKYDRAKHICPACKR